VDEVHFAVDESILVVSDEFATDLISRITTSGIRDPLTEDEIRSLMVLALLLPDHPLWSKYLPSLSRFEFSRRLEIALRLHINSSSLWRVRTMFFDDFNLSIRGEVDLINELCGFKEFNYHLFDHWASITSPSTLVEIELPVLRSFILKHPTNFSPFHVMLTGIKRSDIRDALTVKVLKSLDFPGFVLSSPAYRDFIISLALVCDPSASELRSFFDPFRSQVSEYTVT
jgi:hypothetical protein